MEAYVTVPDGEKLEWLEDERGYLMEEVRVKTLRLLRPGEAEPKAQMEEKWQIEGQQYHMRITQLK